VSWKAQVRLCQRSRQLSARGKTPHQVVVARARELSACMWAIAKPGTVTASRRRLYGPCIERPKEFPGNGLKSIGRAAAPVWCHPRRREEVNILVPRPRQAPDGDQSGGRQPTEISVINRRHDWRRLFQGLRGNNG
jgi:hypothetical protein